MADDTSLLFQYNSPDDEETGPNTKTTTGDGSQKLAVRDPEQLKALARRAESEYQAEQQTKQRARVSTFISPNRTMIAQPPAAFRVTSSSGRVRRAGEITGKSIVHFGSERAEMDIAESIGLIVRDSAGNVTITEKGRQYGGLSDDEVSAEASNNASNNTPDKPPSTPASVALDHAVSHASDAMSEVPADVLAAAKARYIEGTADVGALAESLGITEEQAGHRYAAAEAGYIAEASAHLATKGIGDPQAFADWAQRDENLDAYRGAVTDHLGGNLSGYDTLAAKFARVDASLSHQNLSDYEGPHVINGETVNVRTVNGTTWVQSPAMGKLTLRSAVLKGWITLDD